MNEETFALFKAYLSLKGRKEIQAEWMECRGPWFSILVRNTLGIAAFKMKEVRK